MFRPVLSLLLTLIWLQRLHQEEVNIRGRGEEVAESQEAKAKPSQWKRRQVTRKESKAMSRRALRVKIMGTAGTLQGLGFFFSLLLAERTARLPPAGVMKESIISTAS